MTTGTPREWLALDTTQQTPGTAATFGYYEQINHLVADFDQNIYPLETGALATPPVRDGSQALYNASNTQVFGGALTDRGAGYFMTGEDGGRRTVALTDNVRDELKYAPYELTVNGVLQPGGS